MNRPEISEKRVVSFNGSRYEELRDRLAVESSLAIKINGTPAYFCMRTPGMDAELAAGLCFSDGRLKSFSDIKNITSEDCTINIELSAADRSDELKIIRSSAGIIPADSKSFPRLDENKGDSGIFTAEKLFAMQDEFFSSQDIHRETGATHAAGIFSRDGRLLAYAEDVGRHNALDKCIGRLLMDGRLEDACVCMLSSRLSYEMVLKALRAGFRVVAGVSAPTAFAVELAVQGGMTLIGFMRNGKFNIYSGEWRVDRG